MDYVTLTEAAELEGLKYDAIKKRVLRKPDGFMTKIVKQESGGRDIVLVAVSSLSKQARAAWKEREKLKEYVETCPEETEEAQPKRPWYVDMDLDWYISNYKERYYQGVELGNTLREFLQYEESARTLYAESFAQEKLGKSARTLYRLVKSYMEAAAWADKLQKETGFNYEFFKVLSLCRKPKETGSFPSITSEVKKVIMNIWFNEDFARNKGTREMLYDKLQVIADVNHWKIPSYQTVVRYIQFLMENKRLKNAHFLAERGVREYRNKKVVKAKRDTKGLQVMEVLMGDEHTFDCWVSYRQPNGKVIAIRPKLVAWIDVRSRMIMGDIICKDANGDILKESLLKLIYADANGVPKYILIDNGKDYTKKELTGVNRKQRVRTDFDDEVKGFYQSIGIVAYERAKPYEAWDKGQIERSFRTVCNQFTKWFASYTGTLTGTRTDDKVDKDIDRMLKRGELLTMDEFYQKWHEWLTKVYAYKRHRGLVNAKETYVTPYECFTKEERYHKAVPPREYATMLMLKSEHAHVYPTGINRFGNFYMSEELCQYIGEDVDIKYDPNDISTVYVFFQGKQVCEAYSQELLQIAPTVHQEAVAEHKRRQKAQEKRDREILEAAKVGLQEINEQFTSFQAIAGGIDLMIGKKPPRNTKVVSLPEDNTYRQGFRTRKEEEPEENTYLASQGEKALQKLRVIGE